MPTVTSRDGTTIAYDRTANGPPLVIIDAAGGYRAFGPLTALPPVLGDDFSVIRYDRRGRGESTDTPPYAVDREIEDLDALLEAAGGWAYVYGFSSGAILGLLAAARGLAIPRLAVLEPPIQTDADNGAAADGDGAGSDPLRGELEELLAAGRDADAVEAFHRGIGVPEEITAGMRNEPWWPNLVSVAPTLVYDLTITPALRSDGLRSISTPALVIASQASDDRLRNWARGVAERLPNGTHLELPGDWHGVELPALRAALVDFFKAG